MWKALIACGCLCAARASAFGPEGHLIAGSIAEPLLCAPARAELQALDRAAAADLGDFAALGLWADRIRSDPRWRHTAPWHYMNVDVEPASFPAAERAVRAFAHPPDGDVLWAIERFAAQLADRSAAPRDRADALRFLAHFVVDVHQPLHVGRSADRGGNTIDVRQAGTVVNLHRFWDTDVIALADLSPARYARRLAARAAATPAAADPAVWAAESLWLRAAVYDGLRVAPRALSAEYLREAQTITERRLLDAGRRLAATLNALFCPAAGER